MLKFESTKNPFKGKIIFDTDNRSQFDQLRNSFRIANDSARFARQFNWNVSQFKYAISPLGAYAVGMTIDFLAKCKELGIKYSIDDKLKKAIKPDLFIKDIKPVPNTKYQYRDYQEQLLKSLCSAGRGVIISPTRSGKSLILAGLCYNTLLNSSQNGVKNILIVVPNTQLVEQFYDDLNEYYNKSFGNVTMFSSAQAKKNKGKFDFKDSQIIISNMQWLLLHGDELPYIDLVIQDEVHTVKKGSELSKLIKNVDIVHKFGCTGTLPEREEDVWTIKGIFGTILDEIKIQELQQKKVLAEVSINPIKFVHKEKESFRDMSNAQTVEDKLEIAKKEYRQESMYLASYEPTNKAIDNIAKGIIKQHPNWNVLILFDYINSGENLFKLLDWEKKHYVDGTVDLEDRHDIIQDMNNPNGGHITVANCKVFGTGLTITNLQCIMLVTSQSTVTKIIQAIGRGLRRNEKETLILFDFFHNYKYSEKHFKERVELYKQFYNKQLKKDYKVKQVNI